MEKRRHQRISVHNLSVDASDGVGFLQGAVADVSRFGIGVTNLQRRKGGQPPRMTFVVSGQGASFKMTVRPKWSIIQGAGKAVGAEIIDPPHRWAEFVKRIQPQDQEGEGATEL